MGEVVALSQPVYSEPQTSGRHREIIAILLLAISVLDHTQPAYQRDRGRRPPALDMAAPRIWYSAPRCPRSFSSLQG